MKLFEIVGPNFKLEEASQRDEKLALLGISLVTEGHRYQNIYRVQKLAKPPDNAFGMHF